MSTAQKNEDAIPEDALTDIDFQRALQKLEDEQHGRGGYVFAKGAFDRGDQTYLKEQEEKRRHVEEAMVERERLEFAAQRAKVEQEERAFQGPTVKRPGDALDAKIGGKKRRPFLAPIVTVTSSTNNPAVPLNHSDSKNGDKKPGNNVEKQNREEDEQKELVLAGLLGGYDSDASQSVDDDNNVEFSNKKEGRETVLPSAADLL